MGMEHHRSWENVVNISEYKDVPPIRLYFVINGFFTLLHLVEINLSWADITLFLLQIFIPIIMVKWIMGIVRYLSLHVYGSFMLPCINLKIGPNFKGRTDWGRLRKRNDFWT
jgi:hypothetical protein